jgi:hypothetical protein
MRLAYLLLLSNCELREKGLSISKVEREQGALEKKTRGWVVAFFVEIFSVFSTNSYA